MNFTIKCFAIIFFLSGLVHGQKNADTTYHLSYGLKCDKDKAEEIWVRIYETSSPNKGTIQKYSLNLELREATEYSNFETSIKNGEHLEFHNKGKISKKCTYKNNKLEGTEYRYFDNDSIKAIINWSSDKKHGELKSFFSNGVIRRIETYENDNLITGKCFTRSGKDTTHFPFETMAAFPGGMDQLVKFLNSNLSYPPKAKKKGISGKVYVSFIVNSKGNVVNAVVIKSVDPLLDKEALRVVNLFPNWTPGTYEGGNVSSKFTLPINFKLT